MAATGLPSLPQREEISRLLNTFEDLTPYAMAVEGERLLLGEWAFNLPRSELRKAMVLGGNEAKGIGFAAFLPPLLQLDHAAYLTLMRACSRNAASPYSPQDADLDERLLNDVPRNCVLTRMVVPALFRYKISCITMIARARVIRAGLAVLQHRQATSALPATLDAMEEHDYIDPFTGKSLVYKATSSGFILYSLGSNLIDDGGTPSKDPKSGDIVWRHTTNGARSGENIEHPTSNAQR